MPPSSSDEIALVPYVKIEPRGWTLGDDIVLGFGRLAGAEGLFDSVFIDGNVQTPEQFLDLMQAPANVPVFAFAGTRPIGVAWLNGCSGTHAFGHFIWLKGGRGELARSAGRLIVKYWLSWVDNGKPLFNVILGVVPAWNERAVQYAQDIGLTRLGEVPRLCRDAAGTVLYLSRET